MRNFRERGTHWRNAKNPRLRELAMWEAYKYDPNSEDIERDSDGTITVCFGSTGAELTLRVIDSEAIGIFGFGHCAILAWELHKVTGLPLAVFDSKHESPYAGWSGHVALRLAPDLFLDIEGVMSKRDIHERYRNALQEEPRVLDDEAFLDLMVPEENREDPKQYLCELEQLVLEDFVDFLREKHAEKLANAAVEFVVA